MANLYSEKPIVKVVMLKGQDGEEKLINQADGSGVSFWVGTQAEYDAIPEEELIENCVYYITDNTADDFRTDLNALDTKVDNQATAISDLSDNVETQATTITNLSDAVESQATAISDLSDDVGEQIDGINDRITEVETDLTDITTIATNNTLLWSGAIQMQGGQSINLSQKISDQPKGIVLVFSTYWNGQRQDIDWQTFFVPKAAIANAISLMSTSFCFTLATQSFDFIGTKRLWISDQVISGDTNNNYTGTMASGITVSNNAFLLTEVYGV